MDFIIITIHIRKEEKKNSNKIALTTHRSKTFVIIHATSKNIVYSQLN